MPRVDLDTQLIVLVVFFVGVGLCMWRAPQADKWHLVLCFIAAALWGGLLWFVPSLRILPFVVSALAFFGLGIFVWRIGPNQRPLVTLVSRLSRWMQRP